MLIQGFLELGPGLFAIFYHYALGKTTVKKADDRALSFILGVEICASLTFLAVYIVINFFVMKNGGLNQLFMWIMSGVFFVEALISFFLYFRPAKFSKAKKSAKKSTELFLPRHFVENLIYHVKTAKNRSSTIVLGIVTCALELFFTLPLYIMMSISIFYISPNVNFIFIIAYIIIATIPLFVIRTLFRTDHNLAEIQRLRVKKKLFTRLVLSTSYLLLAIITLIIGFSL